jgi:Ca2+-transporting ATPase
VLGIIEEPDHGWIEGVAIYAAVILVSMINTVNDYSKELQFRALEASAQQEEKTTVVRNGGVHRIKSSELVVGDVVKLQVGDVVPADCIMLDAVTASSNESSLTGEPEDMRKTRAKDPFLLSSCLITECGDDELRALVTGIGLHSQWGKIRSSLVVESVNTPLQEKLQHMTTKVGMQYCILLGMHSTHHASI